MKRIKRIVATVGEYTDREGKTKKQYANIGTLFERDDGSQAIKLESVPIGWNGWASFYELEEKKSTTPQSLPDMIPF
jgi:hypothetical protein